MHKVVGPKLLSFVVLLLVLVFPVQLLAINPQPEPPGIQVLIDGIILKMDVAPVIENNRTLVPLRAIFEALGAEVFWDNNDQSITATKGQDTIWLQIGNKNAQKNGQQVTLDTAALIVNGRTLVPLRFVGESLGADVNWDGVNRRVLIVSSSGSNGGSGSSIINRLQFLESLSSVKLSDGRIYPLMSPEDEPRIDIVPIHLFQVPTQVNKFIIMPPPATVDHRQHQTNIRDQSGRNTCVAHAVLAGMEARYKRLDPLRYGNLDLSEQYANYLQKMVHLTDTPTSNPTLRENQLGRWGGGSVKYSLALFSRLYGVPGEALLPYEASKDYQDTNQPGDNPRINWQDTTVTQRQIDNLNLEAPDYSRAAVKEARYAIKSYSLVPSSKLNDPKYYEAILAAGFDVVISMRIMSPDPTPDNAVWDPGDKLAGDHAMLMVGYDDQRRVFIVKNSWDFDNRSEAGFTLVSYDYITGGYVTVAGYITEVISDITGGYRAEQLFLGRWKLDHDGWKGILDIYRLPGFYQHDFMRNTSFGSNDYRIGTYYHQDGTAHRVNGTINGNRIEFHIDFSSPNLNYDELRGKKFTGYLFTREPDYIAGTLNDSSEEYGFYATMLDYREGVPSSQGGEYRYLDYIGVWNMSHDGWPGTLTITAVNQITGAITATYKNKAGQTFNVTGTVSSNKRKVTFSVPFEPGAPQVFVGHIFSWERGMMSGTTRWNGIDFGWVADRHNLIINLPQLQLNFR